MFKSFALSNTLVHFFCQSIIHVCRIGKVYEIHNVCCIFFRSQYYQKRDFKQRNNYFCFNTSRTIRLFQLHSKLELHNESYFSGDDIRKGFRDFALLFQVSRRREVGFQPHPCRSCKELGHAPIQGLFYCYCPSVLVLNRKYTVRHQTDVSTFFFGIWLVSKTSTSSKVFPQSSVDFTYSGFLFR